ncbi:MAG: mechanosensitive ion channel family protein [Candidatus Acidiferrales bacterium]
MSAGPRRSEKAVKEIRSCSLLLVFLMSSVACAPVAFSQTASATAPDSSQLIPFLNQTINWYHLMAVEQRTTTEPDDQLIVHDNQQIADQVVRLAFDFARAQADALAKQSASKQSRNAGVASTQYQPLQQMEDKLDKQYQDTQAELEADRQKSAAATGSKRRELESQISELQGELALAAARKDTIRSMVEFVTGTSVNGAGATGLRSQIEALAGTVPAITLNPANTGQGNASANTPPSASPAAFSRTDVSGIWGFTADIFSLSEKIHAIDSIIVQTTALSKTSREIRNPFIAQLKAMSTSGDQLAAQADTANPALLAQEKQQLDALAAQFKQISSAVIPLSKQSVLLGLYQRNLTNWRDALKVRYQSDLKNLGIRLGLLFLILVIVIGAAELWRRGVNRYVHDLRRRHQFLLLRKFVLWFAIALIIALTLAGRLGSIVTFAGLLTAGVAVALQNVILSIVGYFFLIGKFGIRVGDRVQIEGVTGEVIDIGLVRLHIMEMGSGGFDVPTGRVVAFSNSIVFLAGAGLFKQIPGTSFAWHEVTLTVPRGVDFALIKEKLLGAVTGVLADYHEEMERQYREMKRTVISVPADGLQPKIHLRITSSAIEVVIRFPVDLHHGAEIDERVSHALLKAVEGESHLKAAGSGAPEIRVSTNPSTSGVSS